MKGVKTAAAAEKTTPAYLQLQESGAPEGLRSADALQNTHAQWMPCEKTQKMHDNAIKLRMASRARRVWLTRYYAHGSAFTRANYAKIIILIILVNTDITIISHVYSLTGEIATSVKRQVINNLSLTADFL